MKFKENSGPQGISLDSLVSQNDRQGIIQYLMRDVSELASKYESDAPFGVEPEDLVGAGYESLVGYVMSQSLLRKSTFEAGCRSAIEKGIRQYLLAEIADKSNVTYDSEQLPAVTVQPARILESGIDRNHVRKTIQACLGVLPERERQIANMAYGLQDEAEPMAYKDIGVRFNVSKSVPGQSLQRSFKKLRDNRKVVHALRDCLDYYEDIQDDLKASSLPRARADLKDNLDEARKYFEERLGNLMRFKSHFGLSRNQLAEYLSDIDTRLAPRSSLRVVELTEEEKARFQTDQMTSIERYRDIASIKRTIDALGKASKPLPVDEEEIVTEAIRELYVPLFATDPDRALARLDHESTSPENPPALRVYYKQAHDYFGQVRNLKIPGVKSQLDDFQKVDVQILSGRKASIIASDMGVGKSLEAIAHIVNSGLENILITTTKSGAVSTWPRELRKHLEGDYNAVRLTSRMLRDGDIPVKEGMPNWFIATHATATRYIDRIRRLGLDTVVIDESHRINNDETDQSLALTSLDAPHKLAISGAIFKNSRSELFPLLNWLFPTEFPDSDEFYRTYCMRNEGVYKLQYELRRKMILRFKDQVLKLPAVEHVRETVTMDPEQESQYRAMEADFVRWYEENAAGVPPGLMGGTILMKMHRLRQAAIAPKTPLIEEIVADSIGEGRKAVLYTTYLPTLQQFREKFAKFGVCHISGRTNDMDRATQIEAFDNDPEKRLFIITSAGGESIDLTSASDFIYANKPMTYADEKQGLDRINRRGQRRNMRAFHITTEGTVDERIDAINARKREEYERVVHGSAVFARWFEENEAENIRELLTDLVGTHHPIKASSASTVSL